MAGEQIKRSISLAVTDGQVVLQEFQRVGRGGEAELNRIGGAAANNNRALEETAGAAEGMSRRSRAAFANFGNQVQDVAVQVQGGTDVFRALSQQVPQALDAFAFWAPALTLVGAGVAIILPIVGSLIERLFNTGAAQKAAAQDALEHKQTLDALAGSFGISAESAAKYQAGLKVLTDQQKDLLNVDLRSTIEADQKNLDVQADAMRSRVRSLTSAADIPDVEVPGSGGATVPLTVSDPQLANLRDYAKTTRDIFAAYDEGKSSFTDVTDALERLSIMTGESDSVRAKEIDGLKGEVEAHEASQRAIDLHRAQYHLLLQEMGETGAFTEADRLILNHTVAVQAATEALIRLGTTNRMVVVEQTVNLIAKTDPQAAEQYRTEQLNSIHQMEKTLQDDADRNKIVLKTGLDSGEAEKLRGALEGEAHKVGETLQDDIKNIRAAGQAMIENGANQKSTQAAVNQLIQEAVDKRQQAADKAKKEREEQELIHAGLAKTKEQADALLSSTNDRYAGLQGIAKIEAEIADKRRAEQVLTGPGEAAHRAELETQINNLVGQRNDLLQKQSEKLAQIDKSNQSVLDGLDAALAKSASKDITQDVIDTAGSSARDRIKLPTPEERTQPGGLELFDKAKMEQDLAYAKGAAVELDKFFTDADEQIAKDDEKVAAARERAIGLTDRLISPQERYNDEVAKLAPLLDGNVEDQDRYNKAIDELDRRLPILQREYELRKKRQAIDELEQSGNPLDWADAGFKSIQLEAEDTGREVSGAFKSGFDDVNHGFFEMVAGQKQGWADLKGAALGFVETLGEVALKQFEIMTINAAIGFVGGLAGGFMGGGSTAAMQTAGGATVRGSDIMNVYDTGFPMFHGGGRVGEGGATKEVDPAVFDEAPRFHGGGSLAPGERPIIAKDDERVLTGPQNRDWENGLNRPVMVKQEVHNSYSGIYDMKQLQAVTDMSAQKAHAQLARAVRSDPNVRRQLGRS